MTAVNTALITLPLSGVLVFVTGVILLADRQMSESGLLLNIGAVRLALKGRASGAHRSEYTM